MSTKHTPGPLAAAVGENQQWILQRIMELQATGEARKLTESEKADLYRLETEWSNRWCLDFPTRVL